MVPVAMRVIWIGSLPFFGLPEISTPPSTKNVYPVGAELPLISHWVPSCSQSPAFGKQLTHGEPSGNVIVPSALSMKSAVGRKSLATTVGRLRLAYPPPCVPPAWKF